jgi:hypothetical protein
MANASARAGNILYFYTPAFLRLCLAVFLFADDFYEGAFFSFSVELAVEDLLPGAEIKPAISYGYDYLSAYYGAFQMSIGVVFSVVVVVLRIGFFRGQFFQPNFKVVVQAGFVIVDKDAGGDVHSIAEEETIFDAAFSQALFNLWCNVNKFPPCFCIKPEFFSIIFHNDFS